ncbi:MAG: efflux RND transporter periplasmic adaptor subunit [Clostridiales bacterium]|jgi:HlyD family secretion protein|nr:efflux RND transporter periplasmic adaptor subunit [Clostridiales bacterium]
MVIVRRIIKILLVLALLGGAAYGGLYWWRYTHPEIPLGELYATQPAAKADVAQTVLATGNVYALETVPLYMTRTQTVDAVFVKAGETVNEGDVLVTYDTEDEREELERRRNQARINLNNAQLGLSLIGQPAEGNERLQYESDVTAAEKSIFDAESEITGINNRIAQQQRKIDEAKRTFDRNTELLAAGAATQAEFDNAETAYKNAQEGMDDLTLQLSVKESTLAQRRIQLDEAKLRLENALNKISEEANTLKYQQQENMIRLCELELSAIEDELSELVAETLSPLTGYVEAVYVQDGGTAAKGGMLMELADLSQTVVKADITEYDAPQLKIGLPAALTTSGLPDRVYNGNITKISAGAVEKEKSSGTEQVVPVEITLQDADDALKAGYTVDIAFFISKKDNVLSVPNQSVASEDGKNYVYLLESDIMIKKEVTVGLRGDRRAEILSGLDENAPVVVNQAEILAEHKAAALLMVAAS